MTLTFKHVRSGFCCRQWYFIPPRFFFRLHPPLNGTLLWIDEALFELSEHSFRMAEALVQSWRAKAWGTVRGNAGLSLALRRGLSESESPRGSAYHVGRLSHSLHSVRACAPRPLGAGMGSSSASPLQVSFPSAQPTGGSSCLPDAGAPGTPATLRIPWNQRHTCRLLLSGRWLCMFVRTCVCVRMYICTVRVCAYIHTYLYIPTQMFICFLALPAEEVKKKGCSSGSQVLVHNSNPQSCSGRWLIQSWRRAGTRWACTSYDAKNKAMVQKDMKDVRGHGHQREGAPVAKSGTVWAPK